MRVLSFLLWSTLLAAASLSALAFYFLYSPSPELPHLSGRLHAEAIDSGGLRRTYLTYAPASLAKGAPLVLVMHGSGEDGARVRVGTGYAFERLADEEGFVLVYPDAFGGYWNACNIVGDYDAAKREVGDVAFLTALADKLEAELGTDRARVFAVGLSRGGAMAYRLALEAPRRFRAVAAVAANVPTPGNFKCKPTSGGTSSVLIMNGTEDPLNPFDGGEVTLYGFMKRGTVRSSQTSAQFFAALNHLAAPPEHSEIKSGAGFRVEQFLWRGNTPAEVALVAVHGGGHGLPQPYRRFPRLLGPTAQEPNGAALIWSFFSRQPRTSEQQQ